MSEKGTSRTNGVGSTTVEATSACLPKRQLSWPYASQAKRPRPDIPSSDGRGQAIDFEHLRQSATTEEYVAALERLVRERSLGVDTIPCSNSGLKSSPPSTSTSNPAPRNNPGIGLNLSRASDCSGWSADTVHTMVNKSLQEMDIACFRVYPKDNNCFRLLFSYDDIDRVRRDDTWLNAHFEGGELYEERWYPLKLDKISHMKTDQESRTIFSHINGVTVHEMVWSKSVFTYSKHRSMVVYLDTPEEVDRLLARRVATMPDGQIGLPRPFCLQHITALPSEILSTISSFLSIEDIKSIRLVCRRFDMYCSRLLPVHTIHVSSDSKTLESLERAADRFRITTIIYDPCYLPNSYAEFPEYHEDVKKLLECVPEESQCKKYWTEYRQRYEDQLAVRANGADKVRITKALKRMEHLKHLTLRISRADRPSLANFWSMDDNWDVMTKTCLQNRVSRDLKVIVSALLPANRLETLAYTSPGDIAGPTSFSRELHQPLFTSLRSIELQFDESSASYLDQVEECLCKATELERLCLTLRCYQIDNRPFEKLLRETTWSNLRSISFTFDINCDIFLGFCARHKDITSLSLNDCCLFGGSWSRLTRELKSNLTLQEAHFAFLRDEEHMTQMLISRENSKEFVLVQDCVLLELQFYLTGDRPNPFERRKMRWVDENRIMKF